jgi:hypothetical protein
LGELSRGQVCARLLYDGEVRDPFVGSTLPPIRRGYGRREVLIEQSRQRYGTPSARIEEKLARWGRVKE